MGVAGTLRNAYDTSPKWLRSIVGGSMSHAPKSLRYGRAYRGAWRTAEALAISSSDEVERLKVDRLREYLQWAGACVPYYRALFKETGFAPSEIETVQDIEALPILTKQMVRELGDALRPDGGAVSARVTTTGGTSGHPLSFAVTHDASAAEWAVVEHLWSMSGYGARSRRAVLRGQLVPGRSSGAISWRDPLNRALILSASDLSANTASAYLAELRRFRPDFLHAYPSTACSLARLLGPHSARSLNLRGVLLSSENVYTVDLELLTRIFGAPVISLYGLSEKVAMACQCREQGPFHVAEGHSLIELVDERDLAIRSAGQRGTIVGTGLLNRATALIRYRTGDTAEYAAVTCSCGRGGRQLTELSGHRDLEVLVAVDGSRIPATAFLHAVHDPAFASVVRFRFVQLVPGEATLQVELGPGTDKHVADVLRAVFAERLANRVALDVEIVDHIASDPSGKFRYVMSQAAAERAEHGRLS